MNKKAIHSNCIIISLFLLLVPGLTLSQQVDRSKLDSLVSQARRTHSDGLVIIQNNKVLVEDYFGNAVTPTYIASVSKALVSMAIVKLLSDNKIKSIDQPVADFYPEWRQGQKRFITLRMLLSHTSGMQNERNSRLEIETGPKAAGEDLVKLALAAEISDKPGTVYNYNNKATCLLPGIIEQASGKRMDHYFEEAFFKPMGITQFEWKRDGTGRPQGHGGFMLLPADLAKFGQLMLNRGEYNGKRFFEERWADSSVISSQQINPETGLIWNLYIKRKGEIFIDQAQIQKLETAGKQDSILGKLKSFFNQTFASEKEVADVMERSFGTTWPAVLDSAAKSRGLTNGLKDIFKHRLISGEVKAYYHTGSWGNYLIIIPQLKLVAVRVVKRDKEYNQETDLFGKFVSAVLGFIE